MLGFLTLKPEAFGLDISDLSLKIIKLKRKGEFFSLASFGEEKIKPGIIKRGEIKDEGALAKIIKEALTKVKGEKMKTKYVITSLPEEKAFLQVIQMPRMSEEELKSAVIYEAENYIPLPIEEVYLDSQIVPSTHDRLDYFDVLIAALPKKTVDPYLSSLKRAGLLPVAFEIESQGISRALIKNEVSSSPLLLIDLGQTKTSFIIFSGHSLRFTASISVSSQSFTEIVSKSLGISLTKAETLKIKSGLGERVNLKIKEKIEREVERGRVFESLTPVLSDLVGQIKKYLNYYQTCATREHSPPAQKGGVCPFRGRLDGKEVAKILLCGGGANLKGLTDFLSLELKLPVELGNPWINILPKSLKEVLGLSFGESLSYTTALGLALRGVKMNKL